MSAQTRVLIVVMSCVCIMLVFALIIHFITICLHFGLFQEII